MLSCLHPHRFHFKWLSLCQFGFRGSICFSTQFNHRYHNPTETNTINLKASWKIPFSFLSKSTTRLFKNKLDFDNRVMQTQKGNHSPWCIYTEKVYPLSPIRQERCYPLESILYNRSFYRSVLTTSYTSELPLMALTGWRVRQRIQQQRDPSSQRQDFVNTELHKTLTLWGAEGPNTKL